MTGGVCVVGALNVDLVVRTERHPLPGETRMGRALTRVPGGKGANQAVAAARAGATTSLIGCVGADTEGAAYVAGLNQRGVGCAAVRGVPGVATGTALVTVDDEGQNAIVVVPGANGCLTPQHIDTARGIVAAADVLVLQLEVPTDTVLQAARIAVDHGVRVVLNPSPWTSPPAELMELADTIVVNEQEYALMEESHHSICVTMGGKGARWGEIFVAASSIGVVDTTGAGDAFTGTLAAALARGADRRSALESAVVAGGKACLHESAQGWTFSGDAAFAPARARGRGGASARRAGGGCC